MKNTKLGKNFFGDSPARIHDDLYLKKPPTQIKSNYRQSADLLKSFIKQKPNAKLVEMGCATGDFANYLKARFPRLQIEGIDYHSSLVKEGRKKYPKLNLRQGSILQKNCLKDNSIDIITVIGVLSMFDDLTIPLKNCAKWLKKNGVILIFNMFNPFPIDCWMRLERYGSRLGKEVGWNIPSRIRVSNILMKHKIGNIKFFNFKVDFSAKKKDDLLRSWKVSLDGVPMMMNGTWIVHPFSILIGVKK